MRPVVLQRGGQQPKHHHDGAKQGIKEEIEQAHRLRPMGVPRLRKGTPISRQRSPKTNDARSYPVRDLAQAGCEWMRWVIQHEKARLFARHHLVRVGQHAGYLTTIRPGNLSPNFGMVKACRGHVDDEQQSRHLKFAGQIDRDSGPLVIMLVEAQDKHGNIGCRHGGERELIDPAAAVGQQVVERQGLDKIPQGIAEPLQVHSLALGPRRPPRFDVSGARKMPPPAPCTACGVTS